MEKINLEQVLAEIEEESDRDTGNTSIKMTQDEIRQMLRSKKEQDK